MKQRIFKGFALILAFAVILSCAGCFGFGRGSHDSHDSYDEPANPELYDFTVDTRRIAAGTESLVLAYIYAPEASGSVELWDDSAYITDMLDDGTGADEVAGDGVYSAGINVVADADDAGKTLWLHVQAGSRRSAPFGIDVLGLPTADQASEVTSILYELENISKRNLDDPDAQLAQASEYAESLYTDGKLLECCKSDVSISFVHESGIRCNFTPYAQNTLAVGDGGSVLITTMDPFSDAPEFLDPVSSFSDGQRIIYANENTGFTANIIANTLPNYYYDASMDLDASEVTTSNIIGCMGPSELIIWDGHGGYDAEIGPFLATGEMYDKYRLTTDPAYFGKFINGEYISLMGGRVGITDKFITNCAPDISGSIVYLNACYSGMEPTLANAFLKKGAVSVIGHTNSVYIPYASAMQYIILTRMTCISDATGDYCTMQEAIDFAHRNYGDDDLDHYPVQPGKVAASIITFGEDPANIRLASLNGSAPDKQTQAPQAPAADANYDAHEAYKQMLRSYSWIPYVSSDLSEIPPAEYGDYSLGSYYVCDIDNNGIDELVIKCGQSVADMSMTVFTYADNQVLCLGSVKSGDAWLQEITRGTGAIIVEHQGGFGCDTYIDISGGRLVITNTKEYNYELPGYADDKANISTAVNVYSVHDLGGL